MKILTQNLKTGDTEILHVPAPKKNSNKIRVRNKYSLISTGTESSIVNFGKAGWINKARQQPARVKDVINKFRSSGISDTLRAIKNKLSYPMPMGYAAVGTIMESNNKHNLTKGTRVFTNSFHQEQALVDYNMCVEIPKNVDCKSATFGAIGGIAIQSISCIPNNSKVIAIVGLGLLGQVTLRILLALGYKCIVYDIDRKKIEYAVKMGAVGVQQKNMTECIMHHTKGEGVDCTIIAASSLSNDIINDATSYTRRKGKIISSGLVGLNLIREKFFKKQIEVVVSNSSGNKKHRLDGSSYKNISYFFDLLSSHKIVVDDLISDEVEFEDSSSIYLFPSDRLFFSKLIKYNNNDENQAQTFSKKGIDKFQDKLNIGLIGTGNFAISTLIPTINKSKNGFMHSLLGREGLSLYVAQKRFNIKTITTSERDFYKNIDAVFIATPHETHFDLTRKAILLSLPVWIEKPLAISAKEVKIVRKEMLLKKSIYAVGYNRSHAPWTIFIKNKINSKKTTITMRINAGKLPEEHWLLDESTCGGRIIGECCHYVDLALTLLAHTKLLHVECIKRSQYYQDTGKYILTFEDGSKAKIDYRHDLPANIPKEKIIVKTSESKYTNNNWKKFSRGKILNFNNIKKGKGHNESIAYFFQDIQNMKFSTENDINNICFSTFVSIKLQKMSEGDILNVVDSYANEILSNNSSN